MATISYFEHHGQKMAYVREGTGIPLLFLHGWGANSGTMVRLSNHYKTHYDCINVDLPGFGISPEPKTPWSIDDYTDFILAFLRSMNIQECSLIAHSFGGRITLKLLARKVEDINFIKVIVTGGAGMKPKRKPIFYFKKYLAKTLKFPFSLLPSKLSEQGLSSLRKTSLWKWLGSSEYSILSDVMRQTFVKTVTEFLEYCLPNINEDILLLWGENDNATPVYQAKRMNSKLAHSELVVLKDAGHYAFLDQESKFLAVSDYFLKT